MSTRRLVRHEPWPDTSCGLTACGTRALAAWTMLVSADARVSRASPTLMQFNQLYFYTSTIRNWRHLIRDFGFEQLIFDSLSYLHKQGCLNVYGFVIMPNHLHLIWELLKLNGKESPAASFHKFTAHRFEKELLHKAPNELNAYKVSSANRQHNFWQTHPDYFLLNYIPTIEQKLHYIHHNPLQEHWQLCKQPSDYPYSSADFYRTGKTNFDFLHHWNEFVESDKWERRSYLHR